MKHSLWHCGYLFSLFPVSPPVTLCQSGAFCGSGNSRVTISISIEAPTKPLPLSSGLRETLNFVVHKKSGIWKNILAKKWSLFLPRWSGPTLFREWKKRRQIVCEQIEFVGAGKVKWRRAQHKGLYGTRKNLNILLEIFFKMFFVRE